MSTTRAREQSSQATNPHFLVSPAGRSSVHKRYLRRKRNSRRATKLLLRAPLWHSQPSLLSLSVTTACAAHSLAACLCTAWKMSDFQPFVLSAEMLGHEGPVSLLEAEFKWLRDSVEAMRNNTSRDYMLFPCSTEKQL